MTERTQPAGCAVHVDGKHVGIDIRTSRFQMAFEDWDTLTDHDRAMLSDLDYLRWIDGRGPRPAHV